MDGPRDADDGADRARRATGARSGERPRPERERAIRERGLVGLAARQHGVGTRNELLALGLTVDAIDSRLKTGRYRRLHRGVYLLTHPAPPHAATMAAVRACGPGAVLSHRSAAHLWRLLPGVAEPPAPEVTVPARNPGRRRGIRVHRAGRLEPDEVTTRLRIPVTTPVRTLLDLAAVTTAAELEQAVAEALRRRLTTERKLLALIARYPRRHGTPALRHLIERDRRPALTRSEAERRLLALIRRAGLPGPDCNVQLESFEVDFLWRDASLIVEVDGYAHHSDRGAFERDRRRDAALAALGYTVIRVTWRQLVDEPEATVARIAAALALRRGAASSRG